MLVAVLDNLLRRPLGDPGHVPQQRVRGRVQIDAHAVDAGFDRALQALHQFFLIHVVLVLAHADAARLDLDELSQRVLQPSADGDRATQRHVQLGELLACHL